MKTNGHAYVIDHERTLRFIARKPIILVMDTTHAFLYKLTRILYSLDLGRSPSFRLSHTYPQIVYIIPSLESTFKRMPTSTPRSTPGPHSSTENIAPFMILRASTLSRQAPTL
ncbi:hypothetical protein QCA50_019107 [Cerrena zonata]|uniref:Uncharacterized protein n=1 Tax=Cerrena zonata TaxID=2478898 RepID=A0AAW0FCZ1_9APHY